MKNTYEVIVWQNQVIIDQFKSNNKKKAIKWLNDSVYPSMHSRGECGIEIVFNEETLDYISLCELGFRVFRD